MLQQLLAYLIHSVSAFCDGGKNVISKTNTPNAKNVAIRRGIHVLHASEDFSSDESDSSDEEDSSSSDDSDSSSD